MNRLSALGIGLLLLLYSANTWSVGESEQLVVFVQPGISEVDTYFQERQLPGVLKIATDMGVAVHVVDASYGAPMEIAITPLIVYQNHRGRSIYQGRTTTPGRIRNFVRTSRFVPQGQEPNTRENIPIWQIGRTRVWAPLKVAAVTGTPPKNYDSQAFIAEALENIKKGFKQFRMQKSADLGRADRGFYMDFYPWLSEDGILYLSLALFSQFHCKEPVYTNKITAPWKDHRRLFQEAAALMETAVQKQINDPGSGDAIIPINTRVRSKDWEKLGFALPSAPKMKPSAQTGEIKIPHAWILAAPGPDDPPMIQFRFPAPLDNYSGEVTRGTGELLLPQTLQVEGAKGFVEIDTTATVTMGEPILDEAIKGSMLLYAQKYPTARFVVESISGDGQAIVFGRLTPAFVTGKFTLKGKTVPLSAKAEVEPVIGENGKPQLLARTAFKIDVRTFDIEGADGPEPARYIVLFDLNLKFYPSKTKQN